MDNRRATLHARGLLREAPAWAICMYSLRVSTTDDRQLPPPEFGTELTWDRLTEALRREVGPDAAILLAEPVQDPARGQTHWHIAAENDPVPLSALTGSERAELVAQLGALRDKIAARARQLEALGGEANARLAAAMLALIQVPDEENDVWSVAGQPVLTAWGRRTGTTARPAAIIAARSRVPTSIGAPAVSANRLLQQTGGAATRDGGAAVNPTALQASPAPRRSSAFWYSPLLWALFLVILGGIYYLLLAACALQVPILRSVFDHCRTAAAGNLDGSSERNDALRDAIREAERRIALDCTTPETGQQPEPRRAESNLTDPPDRQQSPDSRQAEERVREAQGARGKLEVTLAWNGHADLDLRVYCPSGSVSFTKPDTCGGRLDIDRNAAQPYADTPVEHVTWADDPPAGQYRIEVRFFDRHDAPEGPVPFTVVLREGDNERVFRGTLDQPGKSVVVTEFQR
jgi:hypothetical protein